VTTVSKRQRRKAPLPLTPYIFVAPYLVFLLAFGVLPAAYALIISFFKTTSASGDVFVGLGNYIRVLNDYRMWPSVVNVATFLVLWLPAMLIGVTLLALLLHARPGRFSSAMRLIYYLPGAVSGAAAVLLWLFMLDPNVSPFAVFLKARGFTTLSDALSGPNLAVAIAIMAFTAGAGSWIVVLYGALTSIPSEVLEAATVDGCTPVQLALNIKLPMVSRNLVFMIILSFAGGFQLLIEPQLVNQITQGSVNSKTWSINQIAYSYAFDLSNFGAAAAISTCLLLVSLMVALWIIYKTDFYRVDS